MSTPQFSLVVYLDRDAAILPDFLQDVRSFFAKFSIQYEIVFVIEKKSQGCHDLIQDQIKSQRAHEILTVIDNSKFLGRAESIRQGLSKGRGQYLAIANVDMSTPLGDVFKLLQHIIAEDPVEICFGDRYKKKDGLFSRTPTPRAHIETLFNRILIEKSKLNVQDPLCEIFAIRKSTWTRIESLLPASPLKGWYFSPFLYRTSLRVQTNFLEIPIFDSGKHSLSYSPWKARLSLFLLSLVY